MIGDARRSGAINRGKDVAERAASRIMIFDKISIAILASMRYKRSEMVYSFVNGFDVLGRALLPIHEHHTVSKRRIGMGPLRSGRVLSPLTPTVDLSMRLRHIEEERLGAQRNAILNAGQDAAALAGTPSRTAARRRPARLWAMLAWRDQRGRDCREGQAECAHLT